MATAFISDLHLTPERPESTQWFREFMSRSAGLFEDVYILGDLFEFWIGDDGCTLLGQQEVEDILCEASFAGIQTWFMHGNRDFLVGSDFEARTHCRILPDPAVVNLFGSSVLLSHGDCLCTDDIEHQRARETMLKDAWKTAFLSIPLNDRLKQAREMRDRSESGKQIKSMEIMDVTQSEVEKIMQDHDVLTMIHGHTHRPAVHCFEMNGEKATRIVLGDWYTQKSILICDQRGFSLRT